MRKNKKQLYLSSKRAIITESKKETSREQSSYFSRIEKCPLGAFKQAQRGDLSALVISGHPTENELKIALNGLNEQYFEIVGDSSSAFLTEQYRKVYLLKNKVERLAALFSLSRITRDDLEEIKKISRGKNLEECIALYKRLTVQLDTEMKELEKTKPKGDENADYFEELHRVMCEHVKYEIPETITVYGFAVHVKNYLTHLKRKKNEKRINR